MCHVPVTLIQPKHASFSETQKTKSNAQLLTSDNLGLNKQTAKKNNDAFERAAWKKQPVISR
jgi:hypothetical protein